MTAKNELRAEIEIEADPSTVWDVLTDFAAYSEWNRSSTRSKAARKSALVCGSGSSRRMVAG